MTSQTTADPRAEVRGAFGADWMLEQLPGVLAADEFLQHFLRIFQDVADTVRWPADHIGHYVTSSVAPMEFVRWLGKWLNLEIETSWSEDRQRDFVKTVGPLFRKRGTPAGLTAHLEAVTGGPVLVTDGGGVMTSREPLGSEPQTDHQPHATVTVTVATTGDHAIDRLHDLVGLLVPADTIYELRVDESLQQPEGGE